MSSAPELNEAPQPLLEQPEDWLRLAGGGALIVLAVFAVYWSALRGSFLWDDFLVVHRNPLVKGELAPGAIWFHVDFPLTYVVFWLEWLVWGNHPAGFHVVSVLLHAAGALLLWRVLAQLRVPAPWLAAIIFAVHPVCVASVAWISELKNTLSLPFFLLSLLWYSQSDSKARTTHHAPRTSLSYCLSLLAFFLALLSKTSTVMLPVVLLACAWWQRGRITRRDWLRSSPFFALALAFGLMSIWFQAHGAITGATVQSENFWGRLAGAGMALWFYLGKALLPLNLCMIYPRWKIDAAAPLSYLPLLLWCAVLAVCWGLSHVYSGRTSTKEPQRRDERGEPSEGNAAETTHLSVIDSQLTESGMSLRSSRLCGLIGHSPTPTLRRLRNLGRHLLFGLGCFIVTLFPVLGFFNMYFLMLSRVSDHFDYLPLTFLAALAAGGLGLALKGRVLAFAGGALVVGLAVLTTLRAQVFQSEEALWQDTLARNPAAWCAHADLGRILAEQQKYAEAREHLVASLAINPDNAQAHSNLGRLLSLQGQYAEAVTSVPDGAPGSRPNDADIRKSYASALAEQGRQQEAATQLREALRLHPDTDARLQLAALLYQITQVPGGSGGIPPVAGRQARPIGGPQQPGVALGDLPRPNRAEWRRGRPPRRTSLPPQRLQAATRTQRTGGSLCRSRTVPGCSGGSAESH